MTTKLNLCKELDKRGVRIETEKWYIDNRTRWFKKKGEDWEIFSSPMRHHQSFPNPNSDELLAIMPENVLINEVKNYLRIGKSFVHYWCEYSKYGYEELFEDDDNLPEALIKMIIHLIDNLGYRYDKEKGVLVK